MIQPEEVRIGNWVQHAGGKKPKMITVEDFWSHYDRQDNKDRFYYYEPIPLSGEILEKCGFKNLLHEKAIPSREWKIGEFTIFLGFDFVHLHRFSQWVYNYAYTGPQAPVCEYLHQLQNLYYSLTGKELTVTP